MNRRGGKDWVPIEGVSRYVFKEAEAHKDRVKMAGISSIRSMITQSFRRGQKYNRVAISTCLNYVMSPRGGSDHDPEQAGHLLTPHLIPNAYLIHATQEKSVTSTLQSGLNSAERAATHFALIGDIDELYEDHRYDHFLGGHGDALLIYDTKYLVTAGVQLFWQEGGVVLSPGLPWKDIPLDHRYGILPSDESARVVPPGGLLMALKSKAPSKKVESGVQYFNPFKLSLLVDRGNASKLEDGSRRSKMSMLFEKLLKDQQIVRPDGEFGCKLDLPQKCPVPKHSDPGQSQVTEAVHGVGAQSSPGGAKVLERMPPGLSGIQKDGRARRLAPDPWPQRPQWIDSRNTELYRQQPQIWKEFETTHGHPGRSTDVTMADSQNLAVDIWGGAKGYYEPGEWGCSANFPWRHPEHAQSLATGPPRAWIEYQYCPKSGDPQWGYRIRVHQRILDCLTRKHSIRKQRMVKDALREKIPGVIRWNFHNAGDPKTMNRGQWSEKRGGTLRSYGIDCDRDHIWVTKTHRDVPFAHIAFNFESKEVGEKLADEWTFCRDFIRITEEGAKELCSPYNMASRLSITLGNEGARQT